MAVMVEAVRQVMGKGGERQVPKADLVLETSTGGSYMDAQVVILGREAR